MDRIKVKLTVEDRGAQCGELRYNVKRIVNATGWCIGQMLTAVNLNHAIENGTTVTIVEKS